MVDKLSIRYAEDLPDVLHEVSFSVQAGEKIGNFAYLVYWPHADNLFLQGVVGSTGSGKSTLALSFFRFVEAHAGRIMVGSSDSQDLLQL